MGPQKASNRTLKQISTTEGRVIKQVERRSAASAEANRSEFAERQDERAQRRKDLDRCLFDLMH